MPYLTYAEYNEYGFNEIEEAQFSKLIRKAGDRVDSITRYFYKFNDINEDLEFRREQFKKAVGAQVEYFHEVGSTTSEGINKAPQTFSAGRTSVTNASNSKGAGGSGKKDVIPEEVYMYLEGTGLLYAGVGVFVP